MTPTMTADDLNDITHEVSDILDKWLKHRIERDVDRYEINNWLCTKLQELGIRFLDDGEEDLNATQA